MGRPSPQAHSHRCLGGDRASLSRRYFPRYGALFALKGFVSDGIVAPVRVTGFRLDKLPCNK